MAQRAGSGQKRRASEPDGSTMPAQHGTLIRRKAAQESAQICAQPPDLPPSLPVYITRCHFFPSDPHRSSQRQSVLKLPHLHPSTRTLYKLFRDLLRLSICGNSRLYVSTMTQQSGSIPQRSGSVSQRSGSVSQQSGSIPNLKPIPVPTTECQKEIRDGKAWHDIEVAGKQCYVKRSLWPGEFEIHPLTHKFRGPSPDIANRMRNEKLAIDFVRKNTKIPVPNILFYMDEGDRVWLCTEEVEGTPFHKITDETDRAKVVKQLDAFVEELASHRSPELKGFAATPSFHIMIERYPEDIFPMWFKHDFEHGYPLCHGDLHGGNIIVDPDTMEVKAVIDWEHCGYYPSKIDAPRYKEGKHFVTYLDGTRIPYGEYGSQAAKILDDLQIDYPEWWEEKVQHEKGGTKTPPLAATAQTSDDASAKE